MNFLIASDSFKGTFTSLAVADIIENAINNHFSSANVTKVSVGDGGEGTLDSLFQGMSLTKKEIKAYNPIGNLIDTYIGINDRCAFIEMAKISGLCLLDKTEYSAMNTTTYGMGQAILSCMENGAKEIYLSLGGSSTNDGGMGMMQALGVQFYDADGSSLKGEGSNLSKIDKIDITGMDKRLGLTKFTAVCDVENPLTGPKGATMIYGRQKGATDEDLLELEQGMIHYCNLLEKLFGKNISEIKGGGAAGGMGAAVFAYLNGGICRGIDIVLDLISFDKKVKEADIIFTGEGRIDCQSVFGKVVSGVAKRSKGKPVIALVGGIGEGFEGIYDCGVSSVFSTYNDAMPLDLAIKNSESLITQAADRMIRLLKAGVLSGH